MRALVSWGPVIAWCAIIFGLSAQPSLRIVQDAGWDLIIRKLGHMAAFGCLALLTWRALAMTTGLRRPWAVAIAFAFGYAVSDEFHQAFVAGRVASPLDVAIDTIGIFVAVGAAAWLVRSRAVAGSSPPSG